MLQTCLQRYGDSFTCLSVRREGKDEEGGEKKRRRRRWMGEIKISLGRRLEELHGSGVLFEVFDAHERWQPYMCILYTCRSLHSCLCGWWALEVFGPRISPTAAQPEACGCCLKKTQNLSTCLCWATTAGLEHNPRNTTSFKRDQWSVLNSAVLVRAARRFLVPPQSALRLFT